VITRRYISSHIIDAEFSQDDSENITSSSPTSHSSLLSTSLAMDPDWKEIAIEFVDPDSPGKSKYIDCNMAFIVEMDGVSYAIGTPCENQVAILCEGDLASGNRNSFFIDPDDDSNLELMEIAAAEFYKAFGQESGVKFKRTPRTLTVEGDLGVITGDWQKEREERLHSINLDDFLSDNKSTDGDDDEAFLDSFFRRELGENYESEFLVEDEEIDREARDLSEFFNIPGIGTEQDDKEGINELLDDVFAGGDFAQKEEFDAKKNSLVETALRLVGFQGPDGKAYSLVQMLQPIILVGKDDPTLDSTQRVLLSPEEADEVIPRLEIAFKKEFEAAGLKL